MRRLASLFAAALLVVAVVPHPLLAGTALPTPDAGDGAPGGVLTPLEAVELGADADGRRITVRGEAIGEALSGGDGAVWVNLLDDATAIGVWGPAALAEQIGLFGMYRQRGDIVEVSGTYNAACDQHGGDRDIHFDELAVVAQGHALDEPVRWWKLGLGAALMAVAAALWTSYRRRADRAY